MQNVPFLASLLSSLVGGQIPAGIFRFILGLIPEIADVVQTFMDQKYKGGDKAAAVVAATAELIDEKLDDIPEWADLSEEQRDRMLYGLVEWVYWGLTLKEKHGRRGSRKLMKLALRKLRS
jgi:hypothetical protein